MFACHTAVRHQLRRPTSIKPDKSKQLTSDQKLPPNWLKLENARISELYELEATKSITELSYKLNYLAKIHELEQQT